MSIIVDRESITTKSRFVTPTFSNVNGNQVVVGSENPLPQMPLSELRLEEGRAYAVGYAYTFDAPLAAEASLDIALAFASGVTPEISISGLCGGDAVGYLYEGATVTGGTALTPVNKNRNSLTTSQSAALLNPTVTNVGTMLLTQVLIGGTGKKASGGQTGASDLILKPLTTYLFRITNANGTAHVAEIILEWIE
jgi:hypothetical protein